jgi:hypothetical protein
LLNNPHSGNFAVAETLLLGLLLRGRLGHH